MSAYKTPEQIANDLYWSGAFTTPLDGKGAEIRRVMVQAIEADRAQRPISRMGGDVA